MAQILPTTHILQYAFASQQCFPPQFSTDPSNFDFAPSVIADADVPQPGEQGSDPLPFLPEPNRLPQILKMPDSIKSAWISCFHKELKGLCFNNKCFKLGETPLPTDKVVPLMEVYKCKLNQFGQVDKLKCCIVF